jgi:hypothetical protein
VNCHFNRLAAVAVVILAAVLLFKPAALALVEARVFTVAPAVYAPLVAGGQSAANCDPAYPTVCIPPPPPDLDCPEVLPLVNFEVLPPDPHGFDADKDGIGCEAP